MCPHGVASLHAAAQLCPLCQTPATAVGTTCAAVETVPESWGSRAVALHLADSLSFPLLHPVLRPHFSGHAASDLPSGVRYRQ